MHNLFFKNYGPFSIHEICKIFKIKNDYIKNDHQIKDIKDLSSSKKEEITFLHSKKYKNLANNTKASFCITTEALKTELPINCIPLIVDNVLLAVSQLTSKFYPDSIDDVFDETVTDISETKFLNHIKYGKNVLIGKNVSIGSNCKIGHNTIIEKNVSIGNDCTIGSNIIIRNSIINNNVKILDNCVIGKHGFGFLPQKNKNIRYPHIGIVIINDNCEITVLEDCPYGCTSQGCLPKPEDAPEETELSEEAKGFFKDKHESEKEFKEKNQQDALFVDVTANGETKTIGLLGGKGYSNNKKDAKF